MKAVCARTFIHSVLLACLCLFTRNLSAATVVTQILVYDSGNMQGALQSGGWEGPQFDGIGTISLFQGATQYGPGSPFSIDISSPGTYDLTYNTSSSLGGRYADLELFFDGDASTPGISVVIDRQDTNNPPLINVTTDYYYSQGYGTHSGIGSASFADSENIVTLQEYTVDSSLGTWQGNIDLSVQPVPEPATITIIALGFGCFIGMRKKRTLKE